MPEIKVKVTSDGFAKANREVDKLDRNVGAVKGGAESFTKALIAVGAATGGIIAVRRALDDVIRTGAVFQDSMTKSLAIMGELSSTLQNDLTAAAREAGRESVFAANQAADAYFFLASAGLSAEQSIAALPVVLKTATAGQFDLATATDLLTDAQSALGLSSKDAIVNQENMIRVSDVLVKANTLANASVRQFSEALTTKAATALRIVNKDVEEGTAVLAAFADQGIKGALAGDALNIVLRDLSNAALAAPKAFDAVGISVFDSAGKMRNMADILRDLEGALAGASDEQTRMTLKALKFQDRSVSYLLALVGMSDRIRELDSSLRRAGGTTQDVADKQMASLVNQTKLVTGRIEDLKLEIFSGLEPSLTKVVKGTKEWLDVNDAWLKLKIHESIKAAADEMQILGTVLSPVVDGIKTLGTIFGSLPSGSVEFGLIGSLLFGTSAGKAIAAAAGALGVIGLAREAGTKAGDQAGARKQVLDAKARFRFGDRRLSFAEAALIESDTEGNDRDIAAAILARNNRIIEDAEIQKWIKEGGFDGAISKALEANNSGQLNSLKSVSGDVRFVTDAFGNVTAAMSLAEPVFKITSEGFGEVSRGAMAAAEAVEESGNSAGRAFAAWREGSSALFEVDRQIEANQRTLDDWRESQIRAIDAMITMGDEANSIRLNVRPYQALSEEIERIEKLATRFPELLPEDVKNDAIRQAAANMTDFGNESESALSGIQDAVDSVGQNFEDTFVNAITGHKTSVKDFVDAVISDLARIGTQEFITKPIFGGIVESVTSSTKEGDIDRRIERASNSAVRESASQVESHWSSAADQVGDKFSGMIDGVGSAATTMITGAGGLFTSILIGLFGGGGGGFSLGGLGKSFAFGAASGAAGNVFGNIDLNGLFGGGSNGPPVGQGTVFDNSPGPGRGTVLRPEHSPLPLLEQLGQSNFNGGFVPQRGAVRTREQSAASRTGPTEVINITVPVEVIVQRLKPADERNAILEQMPLIEQGIVRAAKRGGDVAAAFRLRRG